MFNPWVGKIPWKRKWTPTSVFLPGKSHGQRSLEGYSPWGHKRVGRDLISKQQLCARVLFSPHPGQHLLFVGFVLFFILKRYEVNSHCDFDMHFSNDIQHLFVFLLAICIPFLKKCLFGYSAPF